MKKLSEHQKPPKRGTMVKYWMAPDGAEALNARKYDGCFK